MNRVKEWYRQLRWNATAHGWIVRTDEVSIFVSEQAYEEQVRAYFAHQGKVRKTYSEIMRLAEAEWREQGDIEHALQQDIDYWLTCPVRGVSVRRHGIPNEE